MSALIQLSQMGEVNIKARGMAISRAVDVAEIVKDDAEIVNVADVLNLGQVAEAAEVANVAEVVSAAEVVNVADAIKPAKIDEIAMVPPRDHLQTLIKQLDESWGGPQRGEKS